MGEELIVDPIDETEMRAFSLVLQRKIAAAILGAMTDSGVECQVIDGRLGKRRGYAMKYISRLIEGQALDIGPIGTILWAAGGYVLDFSTMTTRKPRP